MSRTPYGARAGNPNRSKPELAASGYIFVAADIRGKYGSEGEFVMNRALAHVPGNRTDPKLVDESSDTYDTVEWMLKNIPNNSGRVGVLGVSYPGFLAMMAGVDHHPAVKAISPQAPMTNIWLGDDFFHNGAFRETYGYDYVLAVGAREERPDRQHVGRHVRLFPEARELRRRCGRRKDDGAADREALPGRTAVLAVLEGDGRRTAPA